MNDLQKTLIHSALCAKDEEELFAALHNSAKALEFEHCAYGMHAPFPVSAPRVHMMNSYSESWQRRYAEQGYLECDPTVAHARNSAASLTWSEEWKNSIRTTKPPPQ